jgi:hypothetical protein
MESVKRARRGRAAVEETIEAFAAGKRQILPRERPSPRGPVLKPGTQFPLRREAEMPVGEEMPAEEGERA